MTNLSISTHDNKLDRRPARASGLGPRLLALLFSSDSMTFRPRISGRALETVARLSRTRIGARLLLRAFRANLRLAELEELADRHFGEVPVDNRPIAGRSPRDMPDAELPPPRASWSPSSETLAALYRSGETTPRHVVDRALEAARSLASRRPSVGPLMRYLDETAQRDADASTERWRQGRPIGPLDGVPIVIKEQLAIRGLPTRGGSDLSDATPAAEDATFVARLRSAGAIVLGQAPMTEYGMTPLGFNRKRAMPRNPHANDRLAGGSSTGSAVAVSTGLVPLAVGGDGGGSVRLPSSLCGVFGFKPTWGRISRAGDVLGGTVGHVGPIASSTIDLARCLDAAAGFDARDLQTELAPPHVDGAFTRALSRGVRGARIGVVDSEWADASAPVCRAGIEALRALEKEGAVLVDLRLELARWAPAVGPLTIGIESMSGHRQLIAERAPFTPDIRISYTVLAQISVSEYAHAQRLRAGIRREMACAFRDVDLVALPSAATPAPRVTDAEFESGFLDPPVLFAMGRFMYLGNLTGLPALSAPVGLDADRLPLGLQLLGDAWDEATVLAAAAHLERLGVARVDRPTVTV
jgi:Asp-tRNA(Asn)/Glu-tRNA(Gln) amidotransferase A subunit family amidase